MSLEDSSYDSLPKTGCFTFHWMIKNFSYSPYGEDDRLQSPTFNIEALDGTQWHLGIFPGRYTVTCHLYRVDNKDEPEFVRMNFRYAFITHDGTPQYWCEMKGMRFKRGINLGYIEMDRRNKNFKDIFLPNDTLTVLCHIWKTNDNVTVHSRCSARTRISVERRSFNCSINNFLKYRCLNKVPVKVASKHLPSLEMTFVCAGGAVFDEHLQIMIRKVSDIKNMFLTCKISVLDGVGGVGFSSKDEHFFKASGEENEWKFPPFIKVNKIASSKDLYLQKDRLTLRCEFAISTGIASQEIEESIFEVPDDQTTEQTAEAGLRSLNSDLLSFYTNGTHRDVKLRSGDETFSAHRIILSARSAVFRAMFDTDMKEKTSGIVDIPNLDAEDLNRLLVFLYADSLEDPKWDSAKNLYSFADLYQIQGLKQQCVSFLESHISIENVCECLLFADLYSDKRLMSVIKDFICKHSDEVFKSDEWKSLMDVNRIITGEIMHYVLNEKL